MQRHRTKSSAFTLVELMISIAIVLVLMLGINFVFSMSARTISGGMAISAVARDIRNSRKVMEQDFIDAVTADEMPALVIHSERVYAWRDRQDKMADFDGFPSTYDVDGEQGSGDEVILQQTAPPFAENLPGFYNSRRHRIDRISFFARSSGDDYTQQTGDDNTYVGSITSPEAWIWYGLLRIADNSGGRFWKPGARNLADPNPANHDERGNNNNFFASQWILGRKVTLLKDASLLTQRGNAYQTGIGYGSPSMVVEQTPPYNTVAYNHPGASPIDPWQIQESRTDVRSQTLDQYHDGWVTTPPANAFWLDAETSATENYDFLMYDMTPTGTPAPPATINYSFWADPFVAKGGAMAGQTAEVAKTTPIFIRGCTQFIVEFAGDFYDQGPLAPSVDPEPVGTIDYVVPDPAFPARTKIRWYGLPRDTNDVPGIQADDVDDLLIPINAVTLAGGAGTAVARFPAGIQKSAAADPYRVWAWGPTASGANPTPGLPGLPATNSNNVRPKLIRITMELIDANGRLQDGQRIEYVYSLK